MRSKRVHSQPPVMPVLILLCFSFCSFFTMYLALAGAVAGRALVESRASNALRRQGAAGGVLTAGQGLGSSARHRWEAVRWDPRNQGKARSVFQISALRIGQFTMPPLPLYNGLLNESSLDLFNYVWPDCTRGAPDPARPAWTQPSCDTPLRIGPVREPHYHSRIQLETEPAYLERLQTWRASALALNARLGAPFQLTCYAAQPVYATGVFVRSAFFVADDLLVVPLSYSFVSKGGRDDVKTWLMRSQAKLVQRDAQPLAALECVLAPEGNVVLCGVTSILVPDVGERRGLAFAVALGAKTDFFIPVEHVAADSAPAGGGAHICVQGFLYQEAVLGRMPDFFVNQFVRFYGEKLKATDIHVYTSNLEQVDAAAGIFESGELRAPAAAAGHPTRVWLHDSTFPEFNRSMRILLGTQKKHQKLAMHDCANRAKAMGAKWIFYADLDEYLFFDQHVDSQHSLVDFMDAHYSDCGVVYAPSLWFDTVRCIRDPDNGRPAKSYADFMHHWALAKVDSTYMGRRKPLVQVALFSAIELALGIDIETHVINYVNLMRQPARKSATDVLHIHHYRDGWHQRVCNSTLEVSDMALLETPTRNLSRQTHALHMPRAEREWFL